MHRAEDLRQADTMLLLASQGLISTSSGILLDQASHCAQCLQLVEELEVAEGRMDRPRTWIRGSAKAVGLASQS